MLKGGTKMNLFRNFFRKAVSTPTQKSPIQRPIPTHQGTSQEKEEDYTFDVVGESFRRDHLVQLIKIHKSTQNGELYTTATLELEPDNAFDSTAVKVMVENMQVGYIPKSMSAEMTDYIKAKGGNTLDVPARIGWDTDSPQPLVGVRLKMEDFE
jgi:hypothetical protein